MWHTAKYVDPYSELVLCIYPSKCTHTAVNTHPEQWEVVFMLRRPGSRRGFGALLKASRHGIEGGERVLYIHSHHHQQSLQDRDLNSQPFNYESGSLPLGHDFPT